MPKPFGQPEDRELALFYTNEVTQLCLQIQKFQFSSKTNIALMELNLYALMVVICIF